MNVESLTNCNLVILLWAHLTKSNVKFSLYCLYIPEMVMGELTIGLGVALDLVWSFWGGAGDELALDEAIWRKNGSGDEARGLPDSISVKHNLVNIRYKGEKPAYGQHTTETLIRLYRQNYHITLNKLEHWTKIITIYVFSHPIH